MRLINKSLPKYPNDGDRRCIKRFALFPVWVFDEQRKILVWLEYYNDHQIYDDDLDFSYGWLTINKTLWRQ